MINRRQLRGLCSSDSPDFATVRLTNLTDGCIPYHVSDASGLADGPLKSAVDDAVQQLIMRNKQETDANYVLAPGYNGTVLGPWAVGNTYAFTVTNGSRFMVLND
jgi:hypothetical protein